MNCLCAFGEPNILTLSMLSSTQFAPLANVCDVDPTPPSYASCSLLTGTIAVNFGNSYRISNVSGSDIVFTSICSMYHIYGTKDGINWVLIREAPGSSTLTTIGIEVNTWYKQLSFSFESVYLIGLQVTDIKIYSPGLATFSYFDGLGIGAAPTTEPLSIAGTLSATAFYDYTNRAYYMDLDNASVSINAAGNITAASHSITGNVGIGCTNPTAKLTVNGLIRATGIEIVSAPCADYVFEKDYNLMNILDVEKYVNANKHLPEIPSAKEFKAEGYKVAEMDELLLKKIEELTLYIIALKKDNEKMQREINSMKQLTTK
jgi:hypothetical protein